MLLLLIDSLMIDSFFLNESTCLLIIYCFFDDQWSMMMMMMMMWIMQQNKFSNVQSFFYHGTHTYTHRNMDLETECKNEKNIYRQSGTEHFILQFFLFVSFAGIHLFSSRFFLVLVSGTITTTTTTTE